MAHKKIFCTMFLLFLFLPALLGMAIKVTDFEVDVQLNNVETYEKPDLSLNSFFAGTFQKEYENWIGNSYTGRSIVIKTYNQIRFSLFHVSNLIVGKNKDLFQEQYIKEYLGLDSKYNFADLDNKMSLEAYVDKLSDISKMLSDQNKVLIFLLSPSKCDYNFSDIPEKYFVQMQQEYVRGLDILRELLAEKDIYYIDSYDIISKCNLNCPIFYNSGIHWSRPIEQLIDAQILDMIEEISGNKVKKFKLGALSEIDGAGYRDKDIWNVMNIWEESDEKYYEYTTEPIVPQNYMDLNVLLQGGSFVLGVREDFILNKVCNDINYIFYNQYIFKMDGSQTEISYNNNPDISNSDWSNLDLEGLINQSNVIIIELNAEHVYALNNGFVDLLYDYLVNRKTSEAFLENLDFNGEYVQQSEYLKGLYEYEEDVDGKFVWVSENASIELHNHNIYDKGLRIILDIPSQNVAPENKMLIKVNGQITQELAWDNAERKEIIILPELINRLEGDKIMIEFECPTSFNPFKMGLNNDDRDLAVMIRYMGEVK